MYTHIIWDFDGTLFDTYPMMVNAFKKALEDEGIIGAYETIMLHMKVSEANVIDHYREHYDISIMFKERYDRYRKEANEELVRPFENVQDICKAIWLSNKQNYLYTHRGISSSREYLKRYDMEQYFTEYITRENGFKRKPEPEALLYLLDKYSIKKSEAIMIGDRDIDILVAKNTGISSCFFNNGMQIESLIADYNVSNIRELFNIINV